MLLFKQALPGVAQKAEPVYSFAREQHEMNWYLEQAEAWKKETQKNPKNGLAWYYCYYANRILLYHEHGKENNTELYKKRIDDLLEEMKKNIPDSYEYNLCVWAHGGLNLELLPYLEKANELGPSRVEHFDHMVNIAEINRNRKERDRYTLKLKEAGVVSPGMLNYNYNVLSGLEENAILLTAGDNDTYPAFVLQAMGIRQDVTVINFSLLQIDDYREKIFRELGVELPGFRIWDEPDSVGVRIKRMEKLLLGLLAGNKKDHPVYVALTAAGSERHVKPYEDKLYLTGLAYQYCETQPDHIARLRRNFEKTYRLDYLGAHFYSDISEELVRTINRNYLVPMIKLYEHYQNSDEQNRAAWIKALILEVATGTPDEKAVKEMLKEK